MVIVYPLKAATLETEKQSRGQIKTAHDREDDRSLEAIKSNNAQKQPEEDPLEDT